MPGSFRIPVLFPWPHGIAGTGISPWRHGIADIAGCVVLPWINHIRVWNNTHRFSRSITRRQEESQSKGRRLYKRDVPLTKNDEKSTIVRRYLSGVARTLSKRDTRAENVPRVRTKREDEDEDVEKEEPLDLCFNPDEPCYQNSDVKESQLLGLTPYKTYHIRIAAYNSGGLGPWSDELIFDTAQAPPGPPYSVNTYAYDRFCKLTWKVCAFWKIHRFCVN